jgi:hypothetical protein
MFVKSCFPFSLHQLHLNKKRRKKSGYIKRIRKRCFSEKSVDVSSRTKSERCKRVQINVGNMRKEKHGSHSI